MKKRRPKSITAVPVASMGDIAFLLIIFFMVCSNFAKEASVKLSPPKSEDIEQIKESGVSVSIDKDGLIYIQGQLVPDAEAVEWGVAALMQNKVTHEGRTVMFKCDAEIGRDVFEPVLDAIARSGALIAAVGEIGPAPK